MPVNRAGSAFALLCISNMVCSLPGLSANPLAAAAAAPQPIPTLTSKPIDLTSHPPFLGVLARDRNPAVIKIFIPESINSILEVSNA